MASRDINVIALVKGGERYVFLFDDDSRAEASREARITIVGRACREVDQQSGPKIDELAARIRERVWQPLVGLGLEPTPVALETTADVASLRLRLAAGSQLAAHTPRPRAPAEDDGVLAESGLTSVLDVPSWVEAIGIVIAGNLAARTRSGRGDGGKGR